MTRFLFLPVFLFFSTIIFAQEHLFNLESTEVNLAELSATEYSKDSTANAFYIYENGRSRFENGSDYNLLTDYEGKIKILNKDGFDQANIKIRLHKGKRGEQKLRDLKAATYYIENGLIKVQHLSEDQIFTEKNPEYDLVKFTFPAVQPGAVLVYSYQKENPYSFNFQTWWFQEDIPKMYSRFLAEIPGNYKYNIMLVGSLKLAEENIDIKRSCLQIQGFPQPADCTRTEYIMKDIPSFKEEKYLTSAYNYISRLEYELSEFVNPNGGYKQKYTKTWKDVDKELRSENDLGKQLRKTKWVRGVLPENISKLPNDIKKARDIYNFVKDHYTWNGDYEIFRNVSIKDLLKEKTGNVSAINILLNNIYKEEGFEVLPILSSTRSNGTPTQLYPVLSEFNYLMVQLQIDEEKFLLDATEKNASFGLIPFRTLNLRGRLLDFNNGSSWIDLEPQGYSSVVMQDSLKLNPDGTTTGISSHSFSGYHALRVRNSLENLDKEEIFGSLSNPNKETGSLSATTLHTDELEENVTISYELKNSSQKVNDLIYVNPFSFRFFSENPFKLQERTYPIDFGYKDAYTYNIRLEIPEGYEIVELPEQKVLSLPEKGGSLHFAVQQGNENLISISCRVIFPKAIYGPGYYLYLKRFFKEMINIQEQSLIVVKKVA
ncbi:MAG: hypothetical protein WBL21_05980 [Salinimicrobium sp.]